MKKGEVPCPPGIDTDANGVIVIPRKNAYLDTNYISCTAGDLIVPLTAADVTTANVQDN